jgi:predicted DNA-binding protein (MmcQ/YjbR family)
MLEIPNKEGRIQATFFCQETNVLLNDASQIIIFEQTTFAMTIEDIQAICKKLKGVTEDIKWEDHLCFNVGGKMFLVTAPDHSPISASIKVSDEDFETLPERRGFMPAPYMARHKWIKMDDINLLSKKEWEYYLKTAYSLVGSKLSAKLRKQLGLV